MASSKVMASTSPSNTDLPRKQSLSVPDFRNNNHHHHRSNAAAFGSMNMDDLLQNFYAADSGSFPSDNVAGGGDGRVAEEVWREIVAGGGGTSREPEMTLEDFLTKAGAVTEEDVRVPALPSPPVSGFGVDAMMNAAAAPPFRPPVDMQSIQHGQLGGFGTCIDGTMVATVRTVGGSGVGRGKRRSVVVEDPPLDKATQQKQRRMIKNRESAARSRERKQAYTVELESLVTQLEEENARLFREEAQNKRQRFKQLMKDLIPVEEKPKPPRSLRRVHSMTW